ncbi:hypothetical protein [Terrabacter lapilli]
MRETMAGAHEDGAAGVPAVGVERAEDADAEGVEVVLELGGLVGSCVVEGRGVAVVEEARGLGPEVQAAASEVAAATRTAVTTGVRRSRRLGLWRIVRAYPVRVRGPVVPLGQACPPGTLPL